MSSLKNFKITMIENGYEKLSEFSTDSIISYAYVPNAFTPNNDGDNDFFLPSVNGSDTYNMKIFDRWGGVIYDQDNGRWNGEVNSSMTTNGIYSYTITVTDFNNRIFIYSGFVTSIK